MHLKRMQTARQAGAYTRPHLPTPPDLSRAALPVFALTCGLPGCVGAGSQCLSCYTDGPMCAGLDNSGLNFASCTASSCSCNSPWTGATCALANVGTCYGDDGGTECRTYSNCCAPGFSAWSNKPFSTASQCACQCQPIGGSVAGFTQSGCGTAFGMWCGDCNSKYCTDSQAAVYGCTSE